MCAIYGCEPDKASDLKYYSFPKDPFFVKIWIKKCKRKDTINPLASVVCEKHFTNFQKERNLKHELLANFNVPKNYRNLKKDAVPDTALPGLLCSDGKFQPSPQETKILCIINSAIGTSNLVDTKIIGM